jgi:hypothetical protein
VKTFATVKVFGMWDCSGTSETLGISTAQPNKIEKKKKVKHIIQMDHWSFRAQIQMELVLP